LSSTVKPGIVYLIGAGPGDPGLITVRGVECLRQADVVVYDRLANHSLLAHAAHAEFIDVGKQPHRHPVPQDEINALLVEHAAAGRVVARLKGGDPFVFGRGGEEALALVAANLPFEIVPGITSAIAGPAYAGIPVTHRGLAYSVAFITGHRADDVQDPSYDWPYLASGPDTLIFLMGVSNLPVICEQLIRHGRPADTPVALVERASRTAQKTVVGTLENIVDKAVAIRPPAIIIIGPVVGLRHSLRWFDVPHARPLLGVRVLNTRTLEQAADFSRRLMALGAEVVELPTTQIQATPDTQALDQAINRFLTGDRWDWIIFSSPNNVSFFMDRLLALGHDVRTLSNTKIASIGQATAKVLLTYGLRPNFTPSRHTSRDLAAELDNIAGQKILLPRSSAGASSLVEQLSQGGAQVQTVATYQVLPVEPHPAALSALTDGGIDVVTFISPSAVDGLAAMLTDRQFTQLSPMPVVACLGPATIAAAQRHGMAVDIIPRQHTIAGLVQSLVDWHRLE